MYNPNYELARPRGLSTRLLDQISSLHHEETLHHPQRHSRSQLISHRHPRPRDHLLLQHSRTGTHALPAVKPCHVGMRDMDSGACGKKQPTYATFTLKSLVWHDVSCDEAYMSDDQRVVEAHLA